MKRTAGVITCCALLAAGLSLVTTVWSPAQEIKKTERTERAEQARKRKLDELMKRVKQEFSQAECVFCHADISPNIVKEYRNARDGEPTNTECIHCHGTNHDVIIRSKGRVPAEVCQECHPKRYEESMSGGGHARAGAADWFQRLMKNSTDAMVALTQSVGRDVAHRCTACHSRHTFSKDEAKDPRTCGVCHTGPEYPETDAYLNSKHGLIWKLEGDTGRAPTCVTCHMIAGNHNVSGIVIYGSETSKVQNSPFSRENKRKRELQVRLCSQCHSERFAAEQLELGDKLYSASKAAFDEAVAIVQALHADGILKPAAGATDTARSYAELSEIEQRLFRLDHLAKGFAWKTAFHGDLIGPAWNGWYKIEEELSLVRSEASRLRRIHSLETLPKQ